MNIEITNQVFSAMITDAQINQNVQVMSGLDGPNVQVTYYVVDDSGADRVIGMRIFKEPGQISAETSSYLVV